MSAFLNDSCHGFYFEGRIKFLIPITSMVSVYYLSSGQIEFHFSRTFYRYIPITRYRVHSHKLHSLLAQVISFS